MSSSLLETLQALQATTAARIQSYDTERRAGQLAVPCQPAAAASRPAEQYRRSPPADPLHNLLSQP